MSEAVPDASSKTLWVTSAYINEKGELQVPDTSAMDAPDSTSPNELESSPNTNISNEAENSNSEMQNDSEKSEKHSYKTQERDKRHEKAVFSGDSEEAQKQEYAALHADAA